MNRMFIYLFIIFFLTTGNLLAVDAYEITGSNSYRRTTIKDLYEYTGSRKNYHRNYKQQDYKQTEVKDSFFSFDEIIARAARKHNVPFQLIKAMIKVESNFNPSAVSEKGAKGLMQVMPDNYEKLGINNPFNPDENIMGGANYLKIQLDNFNRIDYALAAYNAGPENVRKYNGIPPFDETKEYVNKVLENYNIYKLSEKFSIESKTQ